MFQGRIQNYLISPMNKELKDYITVFKNSNSISNEFLKHKEFIERIECREDHITESKKLN